MRDNKFLRIVLYIFIGILLLPLVAVMLVVIVGASLYITLMIIDRVKKGRDLTKNGRIYKVISTILFLVIIFVYVTSPAYKEWPLLSWQTWGLAQGMVFIGLLPMCLYKTLRLKGKFD